MPHGRQIPCNFLPSHSPNPTLFCWIGREAAQTMQVVLSIGWQRRHSLVDAYIPQKNRDGHKYYVEELSKLARYLLGGIPFAFLNTREK